MIGDDRYERAGAVATLSAVAGEVAVSSRARSVLVRGEPGIGKSTIVTRLLDQLGPPWTVIRASGKALGRHRAHQTVAVALGRMLDAVDEPTRQRLLTGLGALGRFVAGVEPGSDSDNDLGRVTQAVTLLLTRIAARHPLAIAVDDLHWADDASVELLEHLFVELADAPVLWVFATRPAEGQRRDDVRRFVGTVERSATTTRLDVARLDDDDVRRRWRGLTGTAAGDDLVRRIRGNPLVLEAMARNRHGSSGPLPSYVADLFADEVLHLDGSARDLLLSVAVADRAVPIPELTNVMGLLGHSAAESERATRQLRDAGLLDVGPDGADVGHPVVGEVANDRLPETRSTEVHAAWLAVGGHLFDAAERARLTVGAGTVVEARRAVDTLVEAADRAGAASARNAELAWIEHAVRRARELSGVDGARRLVELLLRQARVLDGRPTEAGAAALEAVEVATLHGLWELAVTATLSRARALMWSTRDDEVLVLCRRAVEIGERADPRTHLVALEGACRITALLGRPADEVAAAAAAAYDAAAALGLERRGEVVRSMSLLTTNPYTDAESWRRLAADSAGMRSVEGPSLFATAAVGWVVELDLIAGRWDAARALLNDPRLVAWRRMAVEFDVAFSQGRWDHAHELLVEASWLGRHPIIDICARRLAVHRGQPWRRTVHDLRRPREFESTIDLLDVFERCVVRGEPCLGTEVPAVDDLWLTMSEAWARPLLAEVRLAVGVPDDAAEVIERLTAMGDAGDRTHAAALRLRVLLGREPRERLVAMADEARATFAALGMTFDAARTTLEAAERGLCDLDARGVAELVAGFDRLGAVEWAVRARSLGGAAGDAPLARGLLTAREMEVARLVAEGRSNAEIAAELVVSVRTVTSHLDHAYTKLGVGSRAALAVYVRELDRDTQSSR